MVATIACIDLSIYVYVCVVGGRLGDEMMDSRAVRNVWGDGSSTPRTQGRGTGERARDLPPSSVRQVVGAYAVHAASNSEHIGKLNFLPGETAQKNTEPKYASLYFERRVTLRAKERDTESIAQIRYTK